jgi:lipopolysaccharide export system protein LptA
MTMAGLSSASALSGLRLVAVLLLLAAPASAQTMTNSFGALSENSDEPIDIESDMLVVQDKQKVATFKGNVKAVQGTTTLRARELNVHYVGGDKLNPGAKKDAKNPAADPAAAQDKSADPNAKITKIEARGDVVITSEDDQTTRSDWALYDLPAQLVTVGGNVVLTQGKNVLKGDRLVIDLKTGESRFENTGDAATGGRIRALFMPKQDGGATPDAAKAAAKKSGADAESGASEDDQAEATPNETPADEPDVPWPLDPSGQPY